MAIQVHESMARVIRGQCAIGRPRPLPHRASLSGRECAILAWIAEGKTISPISALLPISERTVNFHLSNARRKIGAANSRHAVRRALSLGLIGHDSDSPPARAA